MDIPFFHCRDEFVPFEIKLPAEVANGDVGGQDKQTKHPKDKDKGEVVFKTDTVETFLEHYLQLAHFKEDNQLASEVYHLFFKQARGVILEDQGGRHRKRRGGSGGRGEEKDGGTLQHHGCSLPVCVDFVNATPLTGAKAGDEDKGRETVLLTLEDHICRGIYS